MAKRKKSFEDMAGAQISAGALRKIAAGKHRHVAELHGEEGCRGLRPWARRAVLGA